LRHSVRIADYLSEVTYLRSRHEQHEAIPPSKRDWKCQPGRRQRGFSERV